MTRRNSAATLLFGIGLWSAFISLALSSDTPDGHRRSEQRSAFLAAEQALEQGDRRRFSRLKQSLKNYPLLPYLEYEALRHDLPTASPHRVRRFLERHADTPLAGRLRAAWLKQLAEKKDWKGYLAFYTPARDTVRRCNHLHALIETGQASAAFRKVEPLWLSGRSQPDACDPVFDAWRKAGHLSRALIWKRAGLAMKQGRVGLVRYLRRLLPKKDRAWLSTWIQVRKNPTLVGNAKLFREAHQARETILAYGIKRLAGRDLEEAQRQWRAISGRYPFSPRQKREIEHRLAFALTYSDAPDALDRLDALPLTQDDLLLHQQRIRAALRRQDWKRVAAWIDALPAKTRSTSQWRYWRARAVEARGRKDEAKPLYADIARERSYYGFLAADRIGRRYRLGNSPVHVAPEIMQAIEKRPAIQRAHELFLLDRMREARSEWEQAIRRFDQTKLRAAARLAHAWHWHDQAITTLARAREWDDLELRFPLAHRDRVEAQARQHRLDPAWLFALMRQESAFMSDARSAAGAMGLMQLMPSTARSVARRLKHRLRRNDQLFEPATNIRLGTAYLNTLLQRMAESPILATASYNAGPRRVQHWLPSESIPPDVWIETIPYRETRRYVQRVLTYTVIYEDRLGIPITPLEKRMRPFTQGLPSLLSQRRAKARGAKG